MLIAWNVKGMCNTNKDNRIKELIKQKKPSIVGLVKTKLESIERSRLLNLWGNTDVDFVVAKSLGYSGGLILTWDREMFSTSRTFIGKRWLAYMGHFCTNMRECAVVLIYGGYTTQEQVDIYLELNELRANFDCPTLIMGDFNQVTHFTERKGHTRDSNGIRIFNEWIEQNSFIDLPLLGRKFTW